MTNQAQNLYPRQGANDKKKYDLAERTSNFGAEIIVFAKVIKENNINRPIINQLL